MHKNHVHKNQVHGLGGIFARGTHLRSVGRERGQRAGAQQPLPTQPRGPSVLGSPCPGVLGSLCPGVPVSRGPRSATPHLCVSVRPETSEEIKYSEVMELLKKQ